MTTYAKDNAISLDAQINSVIENLNDELNVISNWGVDIYHRIYKIPQDAKLLPMPCSFLSGDEYKPVFNNDQVNGEIGFLLADTRKINLGTNEVDCDVIFSLNIEKILGDSNTREDEKLIVRARQALRLYNPNLLKTGIKKVFEGFDTSQIIYADMHPFLNFSYRVKLIYLENCIIL